MPWKLCNENGGRVGVHSITDFTVGAPDRAHTPARPLVHSGVPGRPRHGKNAMNQGVNRQRLRETRHQFAGPPPVRSEEVGRASPETGGLLILRSDMGVFAGQCAHCGSQRVVSWGDHRSCRRCGRPA